MNNLLARISYVALISCATCISALSISSCSKEPQQSYSGYSTGSASGAGSGCSTVQCGATTRSGDRCARKTTNCSGRCYQH